MRLHEFVTERKKKKKSSRSLGGYFFPGYGYYGSGDSSEGGDGGGGESINRGTAEGTRERLSNKHDKIRKQAGLPDPKEYEKIIQQKKKEIADLKAQKKQGVAEEWSQKYKSSINCSHPRGFSQKAHCAGKKKHNESIEMEMVCEDCGMCQTHGNVNEIARGEKDANGYTRCWPGKHAEGTKKGKNGGQVRNCVPNESQGVAEGSVNDYFKRRKDEEDRIAGTKSPAKRTPRQTDYEKKRKEQGVAEGRLNEFAPGGNSASSYYAVTSNFVNDFSQQKQEELQDLIDAGWTKQDLAQAGTLQSQAEDIAHFEQVRDGFLKGLKPGFDAYLQGDTQLKDQLGAYWIDNDLPLNQDWEKIYSEPWGDDGEFNEGMAEDASWGMSPMEETYHGNEFDECYGDMWFNEDEILDEAEYHGRKVTLGKPMQGDVKKFKVYVKDPATGNIKKVNFGDPDMRIKKSNPARRRSFRARHNCDNPGPRTKARYWSCRKW